MKGRLTWDDLLIQNFSESDVRTWLGHWSSFVKGSVAPVFMSKFGDWFLRRPDGATDALSVLEGTYTTIADSPERFNSLVNSQSWQENHLLSMQVAKLHQRGMIPGQGQCYAFAPHPAFTGRIDIDQVLLMDVAVWQHICAQHFAGPQRCDFAAGFSLQGKPPLSLAPILQLRVCSGSGELFPRKDSDAT